MTQPERRNVLFITADQWRGDALGCTGHPAVRTPRFDAFAAESVRFARHYSNASPCGPSRASLLTGLVLHNHRSVRNGVPLDRRHTTVAVEARKAGVAPALFGYTDTAPDPRGLPPLDPALFSYEGIAPGFDPVCPMIDSADPWGDDLRRRGFLPAGEPVSGLYAPPDGDPHGPARFPADLSETAFLTDRALSWMAGQGSRPWFAHVSYLRPHPPWIGPEPWHSLISPDSVPPPIRAATPALEGAVHPWLAWRLSTFPGKHWVHGRKLDPKTIGGEELHWLRAVYYGLIAEVDHHIGRLLDGVRALGQWDETLIIVTSDHGELIGDHWMFGKEGWFDPCFHVPLAIRWPGGAESRTVERFTEHIDLMPTILDWLRVPIPRQCDGVSLRPWLEGHVPPVWRRHAHFAYDFRDVATATPEHALHQQPDQCTMTILRGETTKYVHFTALPPLFFDLADDPGELCDRSRDPAYQGQVLEHAQALLSWRLEHDERTLTNMWLGRQGVVVRDE